MPTREEMERQREEMERQIAIEKYRVDVANIEARCAMSNMHGWVWKFVVRRGPEGQYLTTPAVCVRIR
jgi:hypothetical protein